MMKLRTIAMALVVCLILSVLLPAASASDTPFTDVKENRYYYDAVVWAYNEGLTCGTGDGLFSPDLPLTYQEICTFLLRYAYTPEPGSKYAILAGKEHKWYYTGALWCANFGIVPVDNVITESAIKQKLTRNDFVKILFNYAKLWERRDMSAQDALAPYIDAPQAESDRAAWNWAVARGVITGIGNNQLAPDMKLNRAQFVTMLWRYNEYRGSPTLESDTKSVSRIRGWQRRLIEKGESAKGAIWALQKYVLDGNNMPIYIDCSGYIEWMYTYAGIYRLPDLDSDELWSSPYLTKVFEEEDPDKRDASFRAFVNQGLIKPGDILFMRTGTAWGANANQHMSLYVGRTSDGKLVILHCRKGANVTVEILDLGSYYLSRIYGIKRCVPTP